MMSHDEIVNFYSNPNVRRRLEEHLGADIRCPPSCMYIARPDGGWPRPDTVRPPDALDEFLTAGCDISRSIWDRRDLIAHLDVEYVNFQFPDEPYLDMTRSFELQEPVRIEIERLLGLCGIKPLHMISGRGHHYTWRIVTPSRAYQRLRGIGRCPPELLARYRRPDWPLHRPVPRDRGLAFAGLGMVMEYFAHRIKSAAAGQSRVPVEITAVEVGPGEKGREMISLDISEYADPLYLRVIRMPFTAYLKAVHKGHALFSVLPAEDMPTAEAVHAMTDADEAARMAKTVSARIPVAGIGTTQLIDRYEASELSAFHHLFYEQEHHPPEDWPSTYDAFDSSVLPPCARRILAEPNDLLMKPAAIELIVRCMLSLGWHPRHIAGLIRSRYERDYGWGDHWMVHDAAARADFYTRVFAGLFWTGRDDLVDFNARSIREKKLGLDPADPGRIDALRRSLLERRHHGRLAHRPFNRLFLSNEHL